MKFRRHILISSRRPLKTLKSLTSATWPLLVCGLLVSAALLGPAPEVTAQERQINPELFPVPEVLRDNVAFWTRVYSDCDSNMRLLHDEWHLGVIYATLDFTELNDSDRSETYKAKVRREEIRRAIKKYTVLLENLATGQKSRSHAADQARVEQMFSSVAGGRSKYRTAKDRFRTQRCLKDQFAEGIGRSGAYMREIEKIFAEASLPQELTRLPFVESLFQWQARSSARAGGIWQFVPSTARFYMTMNLEFDERFDPILASEAAAKHLQGNFKALKTWPLAITAYNHGRAGMARAARRTGTRDLGEIVKKYRSRTFGFASRNFYSEFIAAVQVYENRDFYFPGVEPWQPIRFDTFAADRYLPVQDLARQTEVDLDSLRALNPALSTEIWAGNLYVPSRYALRVPAGKRDDFQRVYEALPERLKPHHQVGFHHTVRRGETLSVIAAKYGSSVSKIQRANRLRSANRISIGQRLLIPPRGGAAAARAAAAQASQVQSAAKTTSPPNTASPTNTASQSAKSPTDIASASKTATSGKSSRGEHVVRLGESLSSIGRLYSTDVATLLALNQLPSAHRIYAGQKLTVPLNARATHVVKRGETLATIARRYRTTVRAIKSVNRIKNHIIHPSQVLIIP